MPQSSKYVHVCLAVQVIGVCLWLPCAAGALRFGYFYGGDGEVLMPMNIRNLAGFIRDSRALVTNWLLPTQVRQWWQTTQQALLV